MRHAHILVTLAVGSSVLACQRDALEAGPSEEARRFAAVACLAATECGCASGFSSTSECESTLASRFSAAETGMEIDADCLDRTLGEIGNEACLPLEQWDPAALCEALRGNKAQGDRCDPFFDLGPLHVEQCGPGLNCQWGECTADPGPADLALGDACDVRTTPTCGALGLYCAPSGVCARTLSAGQRCDSPFACGPTDLADPTLFCAGLAAGDGICTVQLELGEACDPLDHYPCAPGFDADGDVTGARCEPATRTCVLGGSRVCLSVESPHTRSW